MTGTALHHLLNLIFSFLRSSPTWLWPFLFHNKVVGRTARLAPSFFLVASNHPPHCDLYRYGLVLVMTYLCFRTAVGDGCFPGGLWLRICLPVLGTRVQSLLWEDPTCWGATRPCASQLLSPHAATMSLCSATREAAAISPWIPAKSSSCSPQLEKACSQQWWPHTAKNEKEKKNHRELFPH